MRKTRGDKVKCIVRRIHFHGRGILCCPSIFLDLVFTFTSCILYGFFDELRDTSACFFASLLSDKTAGQKKN